MPGHGLQGVEIVFLLLLLFVVVFGALAGKLAIAYPIVLVVGGLLLSFIPGIPDVRLSPDLIFFVILPPLLYSAAWLTSWREFSYNLVSIFLLAFGLVTFTVVGVTLAATGCFPDSIGEWGWCWARSWRLLTPLRPHPSPGAWDCRDGRWISSKARAC